MQTSPASILVVGAGPVGLALAIELARHGLRPTVIEMARAPSPFCRAIGVSPKTLEIFDDMGIAREIIDVGLQLTGGRSVIHRGAEHVVQDKAIDLSDLPYSHFGVPQDRTEAVLQDHLRHLGIEVERGCKLLGLTQAPAGVAVDLERGGQTEQQHFDYVVGCDGAHSAVRKALGIAFEGEAFPFDFMLGDVAIDWDLPRGMTLQAIRPAAEAAPDFFVAIPLPERGRYRVSMMAPPGLGGPAAIGSAHGIQSDRPGVTLAQLQEVSDRLVPTRPKLSDMRWSSIFRISMRLAEHYRAGNVFIAGDACHIHPPTGGQGMNTGIQDAYNLAWKLALVAQRKASVDLLDSYEAERRAVAAAVIDDTVRRTVNFGKSAEPQDRLHDTQLLVSYAAGPLAKGDGGFALRPGDRMPDVQGLRRRGTGFPVRLFDLLRGPTFTLLALTGSSGLARLEAIAARLNGSWSGLIRTVAVLPPGQTPDDPPGISVVEDPTGAMATLFGAAAPELVLVRPDGYIGFAGSPSEGQLFDYLHSVVGLAERGH